MMWISRVIIILMLLTAADSHMLHYLHLKKFLTAVAFARALGKRPTILPIPVPIPIPIAQNEVIKIPIAGGGKTMILDGNKGGGKGISQLLGSQGIDFQGSSPYGYTMPGISTPGVINLSSLKASDSNQVQLASTLGASNGSPRIIVLGGQTSGNGLNSLISGNGPSVIRMNELGSSNIQLGTGAANFGFNNFGFGGRGMNGDLASSFSVKRPFTYEQPYNVYSDKPRRKFPLKFCARRTNNNLPYSTFHPQKYSYGNRYPSKQEDHQSYNNPQSFTQGKQKKPIPVGEKFTYRP